MFYEKFIRLCNGKGVAPTVVGKELGIYNSAISRWKSGGQPQYTTLVKLADYFNVPVSYFAEDETNATPEKTASNPLADEDSL